MKAIRLLPPLVTAAKLFGQYQYFFTDRFNSTFLVYDSNWSETSSVYSTFPPGLIGGFADREEEDQGYWSSVAMIYTGQLPPNDRYEIMSTLLSPSSHQAGYIQYVAAA